MMMNEKTILDKLDFVVTDALSSIADGETEPKVCMDLLDEVCSVVSFFMACKIKLQLKYTSVLFKVRDLYLELHPELYDRASSLWNDDVRDNLTEDQQRVNGSLIRMALTSIYHVNIDEDCDLPNSDSFDRQMEAETSDENLDEAVEFLRLFSIDD